ncbi:jg231, partial [Pararge aegeria aegeria]
VIFGKDTKEYGADFLPEEKDKKYEDDGIYEDIDTSNYFGKMLDIIHEETDSEYYRSLEYCNTILKRQLGRLTVDYFRNNVSTENVTDVVRRGRLSSSS